MARPEKASTYDDLDLKLGIKSSLPNVKSTLALVILLWEATEHPAELDYAEQKGNELFLASKIQNQVLNYVKKVLNSHNLQDATFLETLNTNQLFKSQIETLKVALELMWKLAKVYFIDTSKPFSAERTGRIRYEKRLSFSSNMDIIHAAINDTDNNGNEGYIQVILNWIGMTVPAVETKENNLLNVLNVLSEGALYKLADGNNDVIFNQNSIYKCLLDGNNTVDINGDSESKGSLRILKSSLNDGLNPYLNCNSGTVSSKHGNTNELSTYQKRVDTFLSLSATKVVGLEQQETIQNTPIKFCSDYQSKMPRNIIFFGAPGTGKSYTLNNNKYALLGVNNEVNYERVTFHPDYSYANFVGTYKPVMNGDTIAYKYVPGPFMRMYAKALENAQNPNSQPFLLIIEEINRANVAAVFGDIFQLLDRNNENTSEYPIQASEDIKNYLADKFKRNPKDFNQIRIPNNLFIWATMNSADQGVFPMDTAFKRRWDFTYLGIDENDSQIQGKFVYLGKNKDQKVEWNRLRKAINDFLAQLGINEDKQLGPYFISKNVISAQNNIIDRDKFCEVFKHKVIMYLFEDAAKQKRATVFSEKDKENLRYSKICEAFDKKGILIFNKEIQDKAGYTKESEPKTQSGLDDEW